MKRIIIWLIGILFVCILAIGLLSRWDTYQQARELGYKRGIAGENVGFEGLSFSFDSIVTITFSYYGGCRTYHAWHLIPFRKVEVVGMR